MQSKYACCGGHQPGYRDYANQEGVVEAVPDSCCKDVKPGCGTASTHIKLEIVTRRVPWHCEKMSIWLQVERSIILMRIWTPPKDAHYEP